MYYRRKQLLALLDTFDGLLTRTQLQKLAFILTRWQDVPIFDFVPYRFGCYSFQANQDLGALKQQGLLEETNIQGFHYWKKLDKTDFAAQLKSSDQLFMKQLKRQFGNHSQDDLIRYTYIHYPYYAINSTIAGQYLNAEQLEKVDAARNCYEGKQLFTIGYEGKSLERYLNLLLAQDVKLLCDVRKNSFSMKFGFSKNQLQYACEQVGIAFMHIPQLGIESDKRQSLKTQRDYDMLFDEYECNILPKNREHLLHLAGLFVNYNRIAITCFEAHSCMCHRGRVAKALEKLPDWDIPIRHI